MRSVIVKTVIAGGLMTALLDQQAYAAAPAAPQGYITFRTYAGDQRVGVRAGTAVADGVFYPKRMEGPYNGYPGDDPGDEDTLPVNIRENYNMELIGYFYPPKTGKIQFAISTDDPGELWFSTDDNPANKEQIASESQWNPIRAFGGGDPTAPTRRTLVETGDPPVPRPQNWSKFIDVVQGKPYWIQSIGTEFGGGDNNAVAFRYDGDPEFADGDHPISGQYLSTIDRSDLSAAYVSGFTSTPTDITFLLHDGTDPGAKTVDQASIKVSVDGATVASTPNKSGAVTTVLAKVTPSFLPKSTHVAKVEFNGTSVEKNFTVVDYRTLTPDMKVTADTSKAGFSVLTYQVDAALPNTIAAAEEVLAGLRKDANGDNLPNVADLSAAGADGRFIVEDVINFADADTDNVGNFQTGESRPVPGIASGDNYAQEILTFLDLPAGIITMGVNSDDGFQTTAGNVQDAIGRQVLGQFNGGRGASDTIFTFEVKEAGVYPLRTIWFEGGGDSNVEWFTINNGTKVLLNDSATAGAIKAYRASTSPKPVYVKLVTPPAPPPAAGLKSTISALLVDQDAKVDQASITMTVNGQAVTPTITKNGAETSVAYTPATDLPGNSKVNVVVSFKDNNNVSRDVSWSYQTEIPISTFGADTLFIEAEDFNFDHGKWVQDKPIGMTGKYPGGDYRDLGTEADRGIDWNGESNNGQTYRSTTLMSAGKENAHPTGLPRGTFDVEVNNVVGWNDAGEWANYTRNFPEPAKKYNVYARMSSDPTGANIAMQLDKVTSDPTVANQTLQKLGVVTPGRVTPNWDTMEIFQVTDDNGNPAVVELGGLTTLRYTVLPGNMDIDWMAFVPAKDGGGGPVGSLTVSLSGGQIKIEWTGGVLQSTTALPGGWTDVAGAASPYSTAPSAAAAYFRLRQ